MEKNLIVVYSPKNWPVSLPGVRVVDARSYLSLPEYTEGKGVTVFNLCRSYRYQTLGYYVSLLAAARGHRPLPSVSTIQDLKSAAVLRFASEDLEELIQASLKNLKSKKFTLSIYFGRNVAKCYDRLCQHLFHTFDAPLLRVEFTLEDVWHIQKVSAIGANEVPDGHWPFVCEAAAAFFSQPRFSIRKKKSARYDLAILTNPADPIGPSDERALHRFEKAAERLGMEPEFIGRDDYGRLGEFDALFIRETTRVNHHTFRFSQRAAAEGLVVIDDPKSILRCTNKVYLAELLQRYEIDAPKTLILHRDNINQVPQEVGFPCVLKQPDSSFSQGVVKVDNEASLQTEALRLLEKSDLIIAQEFVPTEFDWRVGIIDREPLYVCRYYMARKHWQIVKTESSGDVTYGRFETLYIHDAPAKIVRTALRAANLIGDGLYGVDLKQVGKRCCVIEVNDNPSIDAGVEDAVLRDELYMKIMHVFVERIANAKRERSRW